MPIIKADDENELIHQYEKGGLVILLNDVEYLNKQTDNILKELEWVETDDEVIFKLYQIPLSYPYVDQKTLIKDILSLVKTYYQQRKIRSESDNELIMRLTKAFKENHGILDHYFFKILEENNVTGE